MATAVTLALTAMTTITNVENPFVFELPESLTPKVLDEPVTFCVTTVETIVLVVAVVVAVGLIVDEGLTIVVVEVIELVEKIVFCGIKEETELGLSKLGTIWRSGSK